MSLTGLTRTERKGGRLLRRGMWMLWGAALFAKGAQLGWRAFTPETFSWEGIILTALLIGAGVRLIRAAYDYPNF
jgi:hypothetical protein